VTREPKLSLSVVVKETALPSASTTEKWVVFCGSRLGTGAIEPRAPVRRMRALQIFAHAGAIGVDGVAPCRRVFLVDQLCHWNFGEVGIAQKIGAIVKSTAKCFGFQVNRGGRAVAEFRESKPSRILRIRMSATPPEEGGGALMTSYPR